MKKFNIKTISGLSAVLILLGILFAVNAIISPIRLRKDVTEDKLYTLSDGTKTLLKELDRDVTLKFYFSKSNKRIPVPLKNFAGRVRDLLKEYESHSGGHIVVNEYDPKIDSDEEEWAQRYGLQGQPLDMFGTGGSLYFGIVAISGTKEAAIPMLSQNTEPQLEYLLTRMISEITKIKTCEIGLMSTLPVEGGRGITPYSPGTKAWAVISELKQQYDIQKLEPNVAEIPDNIDTLIVIQPTDISDATLYAIDQFVLRGGKLLTFTDPMCLTAQENAPQQQYGMPPPSSSSDLNKLTTAWGITMPNNKIVADQNAASMLSGGRGQAQRNAAWLSLTAKNINHEDIATSSLKELMLPFAGTFTGNVSDGLEMTTLLSTEQDGFLVDSYAARYGNIKDTGDKKSYPIAVRIQGKFKTAFPDGKPKEENKDKEKTEIASNSLKESIKPGVVILVADVDMLADRFCTRDINIFGQTMTQPINQNISFTLNMIEQLCGSEALIGLRSRNSFNRPFERVKEMEKEATIKWQEEEERLAQKLQATQSRLAALQQTQGNNDQQLMLTPEQEKEIKKFREEVFQTQQSLKEVRKNLRKDIEKLGIRLKIINILLIPLLVAIFGIWYGLKLRKTR